MRKTSRRRADRSAPRSSPPRSWLSTARSTIRFAPLAGLFSATRGKRRRADEATVESFDEPLEDTLRSDAEISPPLLSDPIASTDPSVATETVPTENVALKTAALPQSGLSDSQRVVLFLPDPVTEDDLLKENLKRAATFRRRRLGRGPSRWLAENAGVIVFAIALLALAWIVATG